MDMKGVMCCKKDRHGDVDLTNKLHIVCSVRFSEVDFAAADAVADLLLGQRTL